jgi:hypothetical protein
MAFHAVAIGHAEFIEYFPGSVRGMTIDTDGDHMRLFLPEFATYHLPVHRLDLAMTFLASSGDIIFIDGRVRIGMRENVVRRMAVRAYSGDGQSLLE